MKSVIGMVAIGLVMMLASGVASGDEGWGTYHATDYSFSMLMPIGTRLEEREFEGGWAELYANYDGVKFYALTREGEWATAEEIERVGVKLTGIPGRYWKTIASGEHEAGWNWYQTVETSHKGKLIFGGYGTGRWGSYLLLLETTESDYRAYKRDYKAWYHSIRLD